MIKILIVVISFATLLATSGCARTKTERINAQIKFLKEQTPDNKQESNEFDRLPLIPVWLKEWKRNTWIPSRISELKKRLKKYDDIILRNIKIESNGSWDFWSASPPEILVKTEENVTIGRGEKDKFDAEFSFPQGKKVTGSSKLGVYDKDPDMHEFMGWISLKVEDIPNGVAGDSITRRVEGSDKSSGQGWISYVVEYEVRY